MQYLQDTMFHTNGSPSGNAQKAIKRNPADVIPSSSSSQSPKPPVQGMTALAPAFAPGEFDVICGRGKAARDHPGNQWFRSLIEESMQDYSEADSKLEKSFVVSKVLKQVRKTSPHGGFVKHLKGAYWEVGDRLSREKIGQTFRDMLHTEYRSSTKQKATVRRRRAAAGEGGKSLAGAPSLETKEAGTNKKEQQSTAIKPQKDISPPRKKTKTISMTEAESDEEVSRPSLEILSSEAPPELDEQSRTLSSIASLSNLAVPMGVHGCEVLSQQSFPSIPNMSLDISESISQKPSANVVGAMILNHKLQQNERQMKQQQSIKQKQLRQRQFAATRTAGGLLGSTTDEPFAGPSTTAVQPSSSFGDAIDEMFQGQLFSSDHTIESSSSGSASKLPSASHPAKPLPGRRA